MYAEVLIEYPTKKIDKYFTYEVPLNMRDTLQAGMKVKVPFGSKTINGFVMKITDTFNSDYELKEIVEVVDPELKLNDELMRLGLYLEEKTLCPKISAYQTMLPSSLKIKDNDTNYNFYKTYLMLNKTKKEVLDYLVSYGKENKQTILLNTLLKEEKVLKKDYDAYTVKALKEKELIKEVKEQNIGLIKVP